MRVITVTTIAGQVMAAAMEVTVEAEAVAVVAVAEAEAVATIETTTPARRGVV